MERLINLLRLSPITLSLADCGRTIIFGSRVGERVIDVPSAATMPHWQILGAHSEHLLSHLHEPRPISPADQARLIQERIALQVHREMIDSGFPYCRDCRSYHIPGMHHENP